MNFTPFNIDDPMNHYLESVFHYDNFNPEHSIERLVPTGRIHLIFELDDMPRHTYDNDSLEINGSYSRVWISGMHRQYISISALQNSSMLVAQFKSCGSYPITHVPASTLNGLIVPAEEILPDSIIELRSEIMAMASAEEKCSTLVHWLNSNVDSSLNPPAALVDFINRAELEPASNLNSLIENHSTSQKTLIDQFKKFVGLTPKYYQRIMRFTQLMKRIQNNERLNWSDIAYDCGFTDQPHFIREFKHFSGFNPSEFLTQDYGREYTNFFPIDKKG